MPTKGSAFTLILIGSAMLLGCGAPTDDRQADNASALIDELRELPYEVTIDSDDPGSAGSSPGIVAGSARSPSGLKVRFRFSMGPEPEVMPCRGMGSTMPTGRDDFYSKIATKAELTPKIEAQFSEMLSDLESAGCRVVLDEGCPI